MAIQRFAILYLALPIALAALLGARGSAWMPHLSSAGSILLFIGFLMPMFMIGAGITYLVLAITRKLSVSPLFALVLGAVLTIVAGYFFTNLNMRLLDPLFPGLLEAKTPEGRTVWGDPIESFVSPEQLYFAPLWLAMHFVYEWGSGDAVFFTGLSQERTAASTEVSDPPASVFLSRVPRHLRNNIIALEADKHYIEVHGEGGSARLLYRFGDAVTELEALDVGIRVHRSWWVAWNAVEKLQDDGKALTVELVGGKIVPVSQTNIGTVRRKWGNLA